MQLRCARVPNVRHLARVCRAVGAAGLVLGAMACSPSPESKHASADDDAALPARAVQLPLRWGQNSAPTARLRGAQLVSHGAGAVLAAPKVVLVRLGRVALGEELQQFVVALAQSSAWSEMTQEYGVGALAVLPPIDVPSPFVGPLMDVDDDSGEQGDAAIETFLHQLLAASGEAPQQTVYVLALPQGLQASPTSLSPDACAMHIWAWHSAFNVGDGNNVTTVPYVVLPDCETSGALAPIDRKTAALSHALVQAVTNPTARAVAGVDAQHVAIELLSEEMELGTLCTQALHGSATWLARPSDMPFAVARVWSNARSLAGKFPCVPAGPEQAYFRADVALPHTVVAALAGGSRAVDTPGVALAPGAHVSLPLHFLAANDAEPAWTVRAEEVGSKDLVLTLVRPTGRAGDVSSLEVRLAEEPEHDQQVVRLTSQRGDTAYSTYFVLRQLQEGA